MEFECYKFVCLVFMGSVGDNSVCFSSRCLWDINFDMCVIYIYMDKIFYCIVMLYGFYYEWLIRLKKDWEYYVYDDSCVRLF